MTLSRIKSIAIIILAVLTLYQTGFLWFVNITNRNFLSVYLPFLQHTPVPEGVDRLVVPWRIITNHGNGRFSAQYNHLAQADAKRYSDIILSHLLQSGTFVSAFPANYEAILSEPAFIFEYTFPMETEWFLQGFGLRSNVLNVPGLAAFRRVVVRPYYLTDSPDSPGLAQIFFLCENGYSYEFSVNLPDNTDIGVVPSYSQKPNYTFIGKFVRQGKFSFNGIYTTNPYANAHGAFFLDFVENQVAPFFNNPASIRSIGGENVWVYRDINTVVRYYETHVLEYVSYRAIDRSTPSSFLNDFVAAVQFVEADNLVINETYLAGFRKSDGQHIFYFNYVIGNMPLTMYPYPITVTVDHGTVVRYRKSAFNFHVDETISLTANADFNRIANLLDNDFKHIRLGYRMDSQDINKLYWLVDGLAFPL